MRQMRPIRCGLLLATVRHLCCCCCMCGMCTNALCLKTTTSRLHHAQAQTAGAGCRVPEECPAEVQETILECLRLDPAERPTAMQVRWRCSCSVQDA